MAALDVSASSIRRMAAQGAPYRFLVTPEVYRFIESQGIYTQSPTGDRVMSAKDQEEAQ
jgi:nicotinic acid mononucleotide adenylyltransferase